MAAITPLTEADLISQRSIKYPNPFFDISANYIPKNIKVLFKYCRDFYHTNGFLSNVVNKLAEYPITDILYETSLEDKERRKYEEVLNDSLHIKSFLIETGLDYFTFGNVFISVTFTTKRFLKCGTCGNTLPYEQVDFKFQRYQFRGQCSNCKNTDAIFTIKDETIKSVKNIKIVRWAPENIDIVYNPITGSSTYLYRIPSKVKAAIIQGNRHVLRDTPEAFIIALQQNKDIELDPQNLYHFKMPSLAEEDMGWGKPSVLPALREIYYLQTLRKGNEAIANEHIVPKKIIFPSSQGTIDPFASMSMGNWRSQVEEQIKKWKTDPNHIGIFPIPMGYQQLGGDAKLLNVTQELKFIEESIINSLGIPLEFIKGGASWSGSSISLRIIENHFLTYRELLLDFLNYFLIPKVASYLGYKPTKIKFKKFKMSDDAEAKQLLIQLNGSGKVSDTTLLEEFGYNAAEETIKLKNDRTKSVDMALQEAAKQAEAQGQALVIGARYEAKAAKAKMDTTILLKMETFLNEIAQENAGMPDDPYKLIERYAVELYNSPEPYKSQSFGMLQMKAPITAAFVLEYMTYLEAQKAELMMTGLQAQLQVAGLQNQAAGMQPGATVSEAANSGAPNNEKGVGNRKQDQVEVKGEKQKASTKGEPN